jgi:hypothetical protein
LSPPRPGETSRIMAARCVVRAVTLGRCQRNGKRGETWIEQEDIVASDIDREKPAKTRRIRLCHFAPPIFEWEICGKTEQAFKLWRHDIISSWPPSGSDAFRRPFRGVERLNKACYLYLPSLAARRRYRLEFADPKECEDYHGQKRPGWTPCVTTL